MDWNPHADSIKDYKLERILPKIVFVQKINIL